MATKTSPSPIHHFNMASMMARHHEPAAFKVILIAGPPSGGKGTQAKRMKGAFPIVHISTGDLLRGEAKTNKKLADIMATGALVDDQFVFDALINRLKKDDVSAATTKGVLLDGFPRNKKQADMMRVAKIYVDMFILLQVKDSECEKRVLGRAQAAKDRGEEPRKDDTSDVIRSRLKIYHDTIDAFSDCYKTCITRIDGNGTSDESWLQTNTAVDNLMSSTAGSSTGNQTAVERAAAASAERAEAASPSEVHGTRLDRIHIGGVVGRVHKAALGFEQSHHHGPHDWRKNYEVHHSSNFGDHDDLECPPC